MENNKMKKTLFIITIGLMIVSLKLVFASEWVETDGSYHIKVLTQVAINYDSPSTSKTDWTRLNPETGLPEGKAMSIKSDWSSAFANPSSKSDSDSYTCQYTTTGDKTVSATCKEGKCKDEDDSKTILVF